MPSASTKIEMTASSEALGPIMKVLTLIDKKVRNLEKRKEVLAIDEANKEDDVLSSKIFVIKGDVPREIYPISKLDAYRDKLDQGNKLEDDQKLAIEKYEEVIQNLEFARELQKQFQAIHVDAEKLVKKQAKRGKSEKQQQEVKRVREVLQLQGLMDSLGSDSVRADFKSGKHGAIVLTDENLDQIDELYKLISPSRDGEVEYADSLSTAADHIVCLVEAKDKPFANTTYKEIKELLDLIAGCGYFEKAKAVSETQEDAQIADTEFELVEHQDVPDADSEEVQASLPPEVVEEEQTPVIPDSQMIDNQALPQQTQVTNVANIAAEADSFFSAPVNSQTIEQQQQQAVAAAAAFNRQRPFQEIVSSVQGNFNFLQESTIEVEAKREFSPHMDPAVVAAHPMPQTQSLNRPSTTQTPEAPTALSQTGFGTTSFGEQQFVAGQEDLAGSNRPSSHSATVDQNFSQANAVQSQDFTSAGFSQPNLTHTLQTDNLFSGAVTGSEAPAAPLSHSVMGQGPTDSSITQFEIPPQIPMPPSHEQQSQESTHQSQPEKKGYHMNPNASEFQSLIYTQGDEQVNDKSTEDTNNFQGTTFTNSTFQQQQQQQPREQRGGDRGGRGGFRGGRGNRGGGGYMSNGYSRGGGGGRSNNGGYNDRNNMGSGGNYQGYNNRNDYRQDGYQGNSGNGFNNNGGFQKRGGFPRGGNRGGPRGGSGSGFNRGAPRGGGYSGRGGNNQGFGRPNFNQQQTAQ